MATTNDYYQAISQRDALREQFDTLVQEIRDNLPKYAKRVQARFSNFYPRQQYISLMAQDTENPDNAVFVEFGLDLTDKTVQVNRCGSVYLCDEDRKRSGAFMTDIKTLVLARDGKWLRKSKYKDAGDLLKRIGGFYTDTMAIVDEYTGGYPYAKGLTPVYPENGTMSNNIKTA